MDLSRRKFLQTAAATSTIGMAGCSDPEEGSALDIWDEEEEEQEEELEEETEILEDDRHTDRNQDRGRESYHGFCDTRFEVPKEGAVYFRESSEVAGGETLEGIIKDEGGETLEIDYLNRVKYLGDEGFLFTDNECFDYSPGGFRDTDYGEWHARCFEVIHEYEDSYLVETEAVKDVAGFDERMNVPLCIYDSEI